jgi:hypothetical protein
MTERKGMSIPKDREGRIITSGPLFDICTAINAEVTDPNGYSGYCILAAAAAKDVLQNRGFRAEVMRVEASVIPDDFTFPDGGYAITLGKMYPDIRLPASMGKWKGHLVAIAEGRWIVDPTLDQTRRAPPMVIEFPEWWLAGEHSIFVPIPNGRAVYTAWPGKGGYKSSPGFRPSHWKPIARKVVATMERRL